MTINFLHKDHQIKNNGMAKGRDPRKEITFLGEGAK